MRIAGISYPSFTVPDDVLSWMHRPGSSGWYTGEGRAFVRINSDGWRDTEHSKTKPDAAFRIAIIGDSYAEALQLPLEETFWSKMRRELSACGSFAGQEIEVLNFGVSSYGTAQELLVLRHHVWEYQPDIVVLAFLSTNDVRENSRSLQGDPARPYFVLDGDDLVLDDSFLASDSYRARDSIRSRSLHWLAEYSRVMQLARSFRQAIASRTAVARGSGEADIGALVFAEPENAQWEEAWRVTERLILAMKDETHGHGADFYLVTLTDSHQVHPDRLEREAFARRLNAEHLFYPDVRLRRIHVLATGMNVDMGWPG